MQGAAAGFSADAQLVPVMSATPFGGPMFQPATAQAGGGTPPAGSGGVDDAIRTIFVVGFPVDLHERELHNTVCNLPGYEASQINLKPSGGGSPQGFVLFTAPALAHSAMQILNDMPFDADARLRVEMAHKNMFLKDDPTIRRANSRRLPSTSASAAASAAAAAAAAASGAAMLSAAMAPLSMGPAAAYSAAMAGPHAYGTPMAALASTLTALRPGGPGAYGAQHHHPAAAAAAAAAHMMGSPQALPVTGFAPVTNKYDNPPCNTLFIGNLGDNVDENELVQLFCTQPGYKQLKLLRNTRQVSCFVEFHDVATAAAVHNGLQGAIISSSDRGPVRIQYSKNPFGKRSPQTTSSSNVFSPSSGALASFHASQMANMVGEFGWPGTFTLG